MACPIVFPTAVCVETNPVSTRTPMTGTGLVASPIALDFTRLRREDADAIMEAIACSREAMSVLCDALQASGCVLGGGAVTVNALSPIVGDGSLATPLQLDMPALCAAISAVCNLTVTTTGPITGNGTPGSPIDVDPELVVCMAGNSFPSFGLLQCV